MATTRRQISIIKPGHDLTFIPSMQVDTSTFGGHYEIAGLYRMLRQIDKYDIVFNTVDADLLFIFGSALAEDELERIKQSEAIKIQCITDLNLAYDVSEIGSHHYLTQDIHSSFYFPFDKMIVDFFPIQCIFMQEWTQRKNLIIYAGGSRNGNRDSMYEKYLFNNPLFSKVYTSHPGSFNNKHPKIPMFELYKEYKDTQFGLVIADDNYNKNNFVTQRPYEYMLAGMLVIYDSDYAKEYSKRLIVSRREELQILINTLQYQDIEEIFCDQLERLQDIRQIIIPYYKLKLRLMLGELI